MDTNPSLYDAFAGADALGPYEVVHIAKRTIGLDAIVVVDNLVRGPALAPVRLTREGSTEEALGLARAITLSAALHDLPFGGGAVLVMGEGDEPAARRHSIFDGLGAAMLPLRACIPVPDAGVDNGSFARLSARVGRGMGLEPEALARATAAGLAAAIAEAAPRAGFRLAGARLALQGFGQVGRGLAALLAREGVRLVAASDRGGMAADPAGLDLDSLLAAKQATGSVASYSGGAGGAPSPFPSCDIWCPTARPDALDLGAAARLDARLVVEATFGALAPEAERVLVEREILVLPDLVAAAGGLAAAARLLAPDTVPGGDVVAATLRRILRDPKSRRAPLRDIAATLAARRFPRGRRRA